MAPLEEEGVISTLGRGAAWNLQQESSHAVVNCCQRMSVGWKDLDFLSHSTLSRTRVSLVHVLGSNPCPEDGTMLLLCVGCNLSCEEEQHLG